MFFDSIFIVNLARRPDRLKSITSELTKAKLLPSHTSVLKTVAAYDGSLFNTKTIEESHLLSPVGIDRLKNTPENQKIWGMDLSPGAIGCALSHVDIWSSVIEQNLQRALVLEDDTIMSERFLEDAKSVFENDVPEDWECVFLSGLDPEGQCKYLRVKECKNNNVESSTPRYICRIPRIYRTTNCYVINANGAKNFMKHCVPFTFQLDTAMTTMLVDTENESKFRGTPVDESLICEKISQNIDDHDDSTTTLASMKKEFVTLIPSYCVDPPLAAQATRFGTDIQWKNPNGEHDVKAEEKSRLKAAGINNEL